MAVFDSYSSRSGEKFFNEIYKSSKQINSQKTSQSILFMCNNNNNNDLLSVFPYNGSSPDKTTTTISKEIVRKL